MTIENKTTTKTHSVELRVNGASIGKRTVDASTKLSDFVTRAAREFGVRSFCVIGDGNQVGKDKKDSSISEFTKIDLIAKDARGVTTQKFNPALVTVWKDDIWENTGVPKAIDEMSDKGGADWESLAVGFALGKGATVDEAFAFARHLVHNNLA